MTTPENPPIYRDITAETGIVPEQIYARCRSLVQFTWDPRPVRTSAPVVGARPATRKRKVKR